MLQENQERFQEFLSHIDLAARLPWKKRQHSRYGRHEHNRHNQNRTPRITTAIALHRPRVPHVPRIHGGYAWSVEYVSTFSLNMLTALPKRVNHVMRSFFPEKSAVDSMFDNDGRIRRINPISYFSATLCFKI